MDRPMNVKYILHMIYDGPWYKRIVVWMLTCIVAFALVLIAVDINLLWLFGRSPSIKQIKDPITKEASEVYTSDSVLMGRFFSENRTPVTYEEISPILIRTLIATEDERFYRHHGVDIAGLFAALKDMAHGRARGASTITQQLAKNLFRVRTQYSTGLLGHIPGVKILVMKAKEWIVAFKLEVVFTKEEILTMYLNTVDFGSNSFGIKTAARTYFGTTPAELTYEQAATLVGLLKATSYYNPRRHPENAIARRNIVLQNLYHQGGLLINNTMTTKAQLDSFLAIPIICKEAHIENSEEGIAPYFRNQLQDYVDSLCMNGDIRGYDHTRLDLYADGLKIYTTVDSRMQRYAEAAVLEQMKILQKRFDEHWRGMSPWQDVHHQEIPHFIDRIAQKTERYKHLRQRFPHDSDSIDYYMNLPHPVKVFTYEGPEVRELSTMDSIRYMVSFLHCGFIAIEPQTREVKAWVGDIDFNSWKYDKVTALRQPGSTFKLFVYTEAMNRNYKPCDRRMDSYVSYDHNSKGKQGTWAPHNANGYFSEENMTLKRAFAQSTNSIAVKLAMEVGIHNIAKTAHSMGIKSKLEEVPALSLGASDVELEDLVNAYCTVINDGRYSAPILITKIIDRDGAIIFEEKNVQKQVIPYRTAYLMQQMLRGGLTEPGGTSAALWQYINPVLNKTQFGGKTGTSNNHSDAWFVGVTPRLVAGGWVGGEYRSIHFRTGELGQGSRTALPIFGKFIAKVLQDPDLEKYCVQFAPPADSQTRADSECSGYDDWRRDSISLDTIGTLEDIDFGETIEVENEGIVPLAIDTFEIQ